MTIFREPLVIFTLVSGLLFFIGDRSGTPDRPTITLSDIDQQNAVIQYQRLKGAALTEAETQEALQSYINDKILLEEAYRLQLHDDAVVNTRLINKVKYLFTANIREPSDQELYRFYQKNKDQFNLSDTNRTGYVRAVDANAFSRVRKYVYGAWKNQQKEQRINARLITLKNQYHVEIESAEQ